MNRIWLSKRGTSLVEILVVMVVLLVGILTVVQMFPTGFRVVRSGESQTIAGRLAQQELERWKTMAANLPSGILAVDESGLTVVNDQFPGPPFDDYLTDSNGEVITEEGRAARGNLFNLRRVVDETTGIPVAGYFQTGGGTKYGSRYTLAFSPIVVKHDPETDKLVNFAVKSGDLSRRKGDSSENPPILRPGQYAIDTAIVGGPAFNVAFPANPSAGSCVYYISYSYWAVPEGSAEADAELLSVVNQVVEVPGDQADWVQVPVQVAAGYELLEIEEETDTCARGFEDRTGVEWSDNPYEFQLADPILGVIAFNPTGHGRYEYTAQGIKPIKARIDYLIYDTRIIREDKVVPDNVTDDPALGDVVQIKLALRFILNNGDPTDNPDEPEYKGLVTLGQGEVTVADPMLVVDLATGLRVSFPMGNVDFQSGIVSLPARADLLDWGSNPVAEDVSLVGRNLRFFYRADGDWAVQCQKAYLNYQRLHGSSQLDYCHYRFDSDNESNPNRLWFAKCEAGKTVAVDYTYVKDVFGADNKSYPTEMKISGEAYQISDAPDGTGECFIDLEPPRFAEHSTAGDIQRVYAVVGTSFKARVIWRDGKRWRHVDMDTTLTRDSGD